MGLMIWQMTFLVAYCLDWHLKRGCKNYYPFSSMAKSLDLKCRPKLWFFQDEVANAREKYIAWVNQGLDLHSGPYLEEFKVCFDLDQASCSHIDKWIGFACNKGVKSLEIDLREICVELSRPSFWFCHDPPPEVTLSALCRCYSGDILESLANCSLFERLSMWLKYLELAACHCLRSMEIDAPNLVPFHYHGQEILESSESSPSGDLYIGTIHGLSMNYAFESRSEATFLSWSA